MIFFMMICLIIYSFRSYRREKKEDEAFQKWVIETSDSYRGKNSNSPSSKSGNS